MPDPDLIGLFVAPLEGAGVTYMVTGGVASVIYGDPRFTRDVDVVLELSRGEIPALLSAFDPTAFYVPPVETLQKEVARSPGGQRRVRLQVGAVSVSVAPIEYVMLRKLEYSWCRRLDLTATLEWARGYPTD